MGNPLLEIKALGQSIWLDNISRELLDTGKLAQLIADDGISGVTSNPTIFEKAIGHSDLYDRALSAAAHDGLDARAIFFKLAYADIREGADLLRPAFDAADGQDGHISFELRRSSRSTRPIRSRRPSASLRSSIARTCSSRCRRHRPASTRSAS